jgi:hypothetical protein
MKKVFPVAFIAILSLTAILYSCKKSIPTSEQNNSKTISTKKTRGESRDSDSVVISHYWQIGSLHNQGIDKLLDNIKQTYGSQYNVYSTTNNNAVLASIPQMSISYVNDVLSPSNIDLNFIRGSINTSSNSLIGATQNTQWEYSINFKSCISILEKTIDENESFSKAQFETLLNQNIGTLNSELEKIILVATYSTAYHSLSYWNDQNHGGAWARYFSNNNDYVIPVGKAKDVGKADIAGILTGGAGGLAWGAAGGTVVLPGAGTIAGAAGCGAIGALGGGLGNSAKKAVEGFIDWLTGG